MWQKVLTQLSSFRMLSYADLDAISALGDRETPFKIQMQIAEVLQVSCDLTLDKTRVLFHRCVEAIINLMYISLLLL